MRTLILPGLACLLLALLFSACQLTNSDSDTGNPHSAVTVDFLPVVQLATTENALQELRKNNMELTTLLGSIGGQLPPDLQHLLGQQTALVNDKIPSPCYPGDFKGKFPPDPCPDERPFSRLIPVGLPGGIAVEVVVPGKSFDLRLERNGKILGETSGDPQEFPRGISKSLKRSGTIPDGPAEVVVLDNDQEVARARVNLYQY